MLDFLLPKPARKTIVDIKNDKIKELHCRIVESMTNAQMWEGKYHNSRIEFEALKEENRLLAIENVKLINRKGTNPKFTVGKGKALDDINNA